MPEDHLSKSENRCCVVRSLWLQERQSANAGSFLHCILLPTWGSVGTFTSASVLPLQTWTPSERPPKSSGSSPEAPDCTYRVVKTPVPRPVMWFLLFPPPAYLWGAWEGFAQIKPGPLLFNLAWSGLLCTWRTTLPGILHLCYSVHITAH